MAPYKKGHQKSVERRIRPIDQAADEVVSWWGRSFVYVKKTEVATWRGALVLTFIGGIAAALIWSAKTDFYNSSSAAALSSISFVPATVTTTVGSAFALTASINPSTNKVSAASLHVTYDGTKMTLSNIAPSATFGTVLSATTGNPTGVTITGAGTSSASAGIDLGVPNGTASITSTTNVAVFNFSATATAVSSAVTFATNTGAAAEGEPGNVITTRNSSSVTISTPDVAAPSGGSINYTNGYGNTTTVALTASDGSDAGTGLNTSSRIVQRKSATLSNGTCSAYGSFGAITPTGTYPNFTDTTVASGNCYQYQYLVSDNSANQATYITANIIKIDTAAPATGSLAYTDGYYGSATVALTAADGTDAVSGLNAGSRIVQRKSATLSNGSCLAYGSFATITPTGTYPNFTDTTVASGNCYQYRYQVSDNATNQATYTSTSAVKVDTASPTGGSLTYTSGYFKTATVTLTAADGTDAVSGLNAGSRIVQRKSATLSNGTCSAYGSFGAITPTGTYPNFTDTTVASGNCYQYQYLISDNSGKQAMYTSANAAKVDTASPNGGAASYTDGYNSTHSVALTFSDGADAASGLNTASRIMQRRSAVMTSGICGSYGAWGAVTPTGTYPNFIDATLATGNCYQYQYLISDNATNQAIYTSANTAKGTYSADISLNGAVDIYDYSAMHTDWGSTVCGDIADIDGNCLVDIFDYSILHTDYGKSV